MGAIRSTVSPADLVTFVGGVLNLTGLRLDLESACRSDSYFGRRQSLKDTTLSSISPCVTFDCNMILRKTEGASFS